MSNPKKTGLSASKSSNKGFGDRSSEKEQLSNVEPPKPIVLGADSSVLPATDNRAIAFTFEVAMLHLQMAALSTVITEANSQIEKLSLEIQEIKSQISLSQRISVDSHEIINLIQLLIDAKAKVNSVISWMSVISNVA